MQYFLSEGMDECDTIALAYQCGQEKAPDLVANAITSVELNTTLVKLNDSTFEGLFVILLKNVGKITFAANSRRMYHKLSLRFKCNEKKKVFNFFYLNKNIICKVDKKTTILLWLQ
jgi:hypothetical protein